MNNNEEFRKELYEIVWSIITQQLMQHITINDDPEDDKLEDIFEQIDIGKYYGNFSWRLWRDGQELTIIVCDNGNISIWLEEQIHSRITISLNYDGNTKEFLHDLAKTITDLVYTFLEGSWHILMDYLSPVASGDTNWRELLSLYKEFELSHPDMLGTITYM